MACMPDSHARKAFRILLAILAIAAAVHFSYRTMDMRAAGCIDTPTFIMQTTHFLLKGEVYKNPLKTTGPLEEFQPGSPWFKFPPIYLLDYIPFVYAFSPNHVPSYFVNIDGITDWLRPLHVLRYLTAVVTLMIMLNRSKSLDFFLLGIGIACAYSPFFESLYGLIFDNLLLFLCSIILLAAKTGRSRLVGILIAIAAMLKIYPAVLVLPALIQRDWRCLAAIASSSAVLLLVGILVFGLPENIFYYCKLLPLLMRETSVASSDNLALGRFFVLYAPSAETGMQYFYIFRSCMTAATAVILYRSRTAFTIEENGLAALMCLMLINLPNVWPNYQLILILPILVLVAGGFNSAAYGRLQATIALCCWLLLTCSTDGRGGLYARLWTKPFRYRINTRYHATVYPTGTVGLLLHFATSKS